MQRVTRRQVLQDVGTVALGLVAGCAQPFAAPPQTAKVHRIAYLSAGPPNPENEFRLAAFRQSLSDLGYVEGQNLIIEQEHANDDEFAEPSAALVRRQPEVIVVPSTLLVRALRATTSTIPIVSSGSGDLIASGLAASYARPGGNVTGLSTPLSLAGKELQLLQEAVPSLSRVAVLVDTRNRSAYEHTGYLREVYEAAGRSLGLSLQVVSANVPEDLEPMIETALREHADGLFIPTGPAISRNATRIAGLAVQGRLPSMWAQSEAARRGGLMAYGPNRADLYRRTAIYVDRLLKGAQSAELPIEQPREFDFVLNLRTAQALGLIIPQTVLLQATEVLQ